MPLTPSLLHLTWAGYAAIVKTALHPRNRPRYTRSALELDQVIAPAQLLELPVGKKIIENDPAGQPVWI
jgi:hypothetical protein